MNYEATIREAHALLSVGQIAQAHALLAGVINSLPPIKVRPNPCKSKAPHLMCEACNCWKHFRATCS